MLDTLKQAGLHIGRELNRAWENLSEGWRELLSRGGNSLTHFAREGETEQTTAMARFPSWSLLAGEVEETESALIVRVELPGMDKEDCQLSIEGNTLHLTGEKRFAREAQGSTYHVMERAFGSFRRSILLPRNVDIDHAEANFHNGVLTVRLPKTGADTARTIPVS